MERGAHRPIFIVGCQRSGTTLMRLILDSHPNISCGPETRFLAHFKQVTGEDWERMQLYGFSREWWLGRFGDLFHDFQWGYAQSRGKSRWADKTPRYALDLEFLNEVFPNAQFLHVVRDGRDVVASHRDRWGYVKAVKAAEKWHRYIDAVERFAATMPSDRFFEVRYEDLVGATEPTLRKVLEFFDEPWDDAVLRHDEAPHDVAGQYAQFSRARRQRHQGRAIYNRVGSHRKELDPLLRVVFQVRSGKTLRKLGYA